MNISKICDCVLGKIVKLFLRKIETLEDVAMDDE